MPGMLTRAAARAFSTEALRIVNNVARQQFTISLQGINANAVLAYQINEKGITFVHTDVPVEFQGKGVGKVLAKHAFDYALNNNLNVVCECHFLAKFYEDNKARYKDLNVKLELQDDN